MKWWSYLLELPTRSNGTFTKYQRRINTVDWIEHPGVSVCVLAVYNKRISSREFKLWTFLRGTESRVATFLVETCVMSHRSRSRQSKPKSESPRAVEFGSIPSKSDHIHLIKTMTSLTPKANLYPNHKICKYSIGQVSICTRNVHLHTLI